MVSSKALNKVLMAGALLIAGFCLVASYPPLPDLYDEPMMSDDYDYEQEESSPQTKPSSISKAPKLQSNRTVTKTGILGEDVVISCDENISSESVILWYQGNKMITSGNSVLVPNFSLNPRFELTILKASPQSAGDYYCQIQPQNVYMHTKVVLGDHSMDVITPESSTSAAQGTSQWIALLLLLPSALLMQQRRF